MFNPESPPELDVSRWVGVKEPLSLAALRGRVVIVVAFQMLCPGCVEHGLPQAKRLRERFNPGEVVVLGLHSVFEHHDVMTPAALEVFMAEYRWPFPVAIDTADGDGIPKTMAAFSMQGTPTLLIFDRAGRLRRHYFGRPDDMLIAAEITALSLESAESPRAEASGIERRLAQVLRDPAHQHGHEHGQDHAHAHDHVHGDNCGCDHNHEHNHEHGPDHGGGHAHDHDPKHR